MTTLMYVQQKLPPRDASEAQIKSTTRRHYLWLSIIGVAAALAACLLAGGLTWHFVASTLDDQYQLNALVSATGATEVIDQYLKYAEQNTNQVAEMAMTLLTGADTEDGRPLPAAPVNGTATFNETLFQYLTTRMITPVPKDSRGVARCTAEFRGLKVSLLFPRLDSSRPNYFNSFSSVGIFALENDEKSSASFRGGKVPVWFVNHNGTATERAYTLAAVESPQGRFKQWRIDSVLNVADGGNNLCLSNGASPDGAWRWQNALESSFSGTSLYSSARKSEPLLTYERLFSINATCAFVVATSISVTDATAAVRFDSRFQGGQTSSYYLLTDMTSRAAAFGKGDKGSLSADMTSGKDFECVQELSSIARSQATWALGASNTATPQRRIIGWKTIDGDEYLVTASTVPIPTLASRASYYTIYTQSDILRSCDTSSSDTSPALLLIVAQARSAITDGQKKYVILATAASPLAMFLILVALSVAAIIAVKQAHRAGMAIVVVGECLARFDPDTAKRYLLGSKNCALIAAHDEKITTNRAVGASSPKIENGMASSLTSPLIVQLQRSTGDHLLDKELMCLIQSLITFKKYLPPSILQQLPDYEGGHFEASSILEAASEGVLSPNAATQVAGDAAEEEFILSPEHRELLNSDNDAFSEDTINTNNNTNGNSNLYSIHTGKALAAMYGFSWEDNDLCKETIDEWSNEDSSSVENTITSGNGANLFSPTKSESSSKYPVLYPRPAPKGTLSAGQPAPRTSGFKVAKGTVMIVDLGSLVVGSNATADLTTTLNTFVECVTRHVTAANGYIDIIRGTTILATFNFNSHIPCPKHEEAAASVAVLIAEELGQRPQQQSQQLASANIVPSASSIFMGSPIRPTSPATGANLEQPPLAPSSPRSSYDVVVTVVSGTCLVGTYFPSSTNKMRVVTGDAVQVARQMISLARILQCPVLVSGPVLEKSTLLGVPVDRISPFIRGSYASPITVFELRNVPKDDMGVDELKMFFGFEYVKQKKFTEAIAAFQSSNDPQASRAAAAIEFHVTEAKVLPGVIAAQQSVTKSTSGDQPMNLLALMGIGTDVAPPPVIPTMEDAEVPHYVRKVQQWENYEDNIPKLPILRTETNRGSIADVATSPRARTEVKSGSHDQLSSQLGNGSSAAVTPVLRAQVHQHSSLSSPSVVNFAGTVASFTTNGNSTNPSSKQTVASPHISKSETGPNSVPSLVHVVVHQGGSTTDTSPTRVDADNRGLISLLGADQNEVVAILKAEAPHQKSHSEAHSYVFTAKESVNRSVPNLLPLDHQPSQDPSDSNDSSKNDLNLSMSHVLIAKNLGIGGGAVHENAEIKTAKERLETLETNVRQAATDKATIVEVADDNALFSIFVSASPDGDDVKAGSVALNSIAHQKSLGEDQNRGAGDSIGYAGSPTPTHTTNQIMQHLPVAEGALVALDGETYYQLDRQLGAGQFGEVFLAMTAHGRLVALKNFSLEKLGVDNKVTAAKLLAEVRTLAELRHPNIASYVSCAIDGDRFSLVMEFLSAGTIRTLISDLGKIPFAAAKQYIKDVLSGLRYLHDNRLTHCDMKPDNVLFTENGECKIADFGTAKLGATSSSSNGNASIMATSIRPSTGGSMHSDNGNNTTKSRDSDPSDSSTTEKAMMVRGTPRYMSPEAAMGDWAPPADVYSVGLMFIEMLTGKNPWHRITGTDTTFLMRLAKDPTLQPDLPFGKGFAEELKWPSAYQGTKDYEAMNSSSGLGIKSSFSSRGGNKLSSDSGNKSRDNKSIGSVDSTVMYGSQWDSETFAIQFALRTLDRNPLKRPTVAQLQHLFFDIDEDAYGANRSMMLGRTPAGALEQSMLAIHGLASSHLSSTVKKDTMNPPAQYLMPFETETPQAVVQLPMPPSSPFITMTPKTKKHSKRSTLGTSPGDGIASPITPLMGMSQANSPHQPVQVIANSAMISPLTPLINGASEPRGSGNGNSGMVPVTCTVSGMTSLSNNSTPMGIGGAASSSNSGFITGKGGAVVPLFAPAAAGGSGNAIIMDSNLPTAVSPTSTTLSLPPLINNPINPQATMVQRIYNVQNAAKNRVFVPSSLIHPGTFAASSPSFQSQGGPASVNILSPLQSTALPQNNSASSTQVTSLAATLDVSSNSNEESSHQRHHSTVHQANSNDYNNIHGQRSPAARLALGITSNSTSEDRGGGPEYQAFLSPLNGTEMWGPSPEIRRASTQSYNNSPTSEAMMSVDAEAVASLLPAL